jgi:hypothetical protein
VLDRLTALQSDLKKSQVKEIIEEAKRVISDFRQYRDIVTDDIDRLESHKRMDKNVPYIPNMNKWGIDKQA